MGNVVRIGQSLCSRSKAIKTSKFTKPHLPPNQGCCYSRGPYQAPTPPASITSIALSSKVRSSSRVPCNTAHSSGRAYPEAPAITHVAQVGFCSNRRVQEPVSKGTGGKHDTQESLLPSSRDDAESRRGAVRWGSAEENTSGGGGGRGLGKLRHRITKGPTNSWLSLCPHRLKSRH